MLLSHPDFRTCAMTDFRQPSRPIVVFKADWIGDDKNYGAPNPGTVHEILGNLELRPTRIAVMAANRIVLLSNLFRTLW